MVSNQFYLTLLNKKCRFHYNFIIDFTWSMYEFPKYSSKCWNGFYCYNLSWPSVYINFKSYLQSFKKGFQFQNVYMLNAWKNICPIPIIKYLLSHLTFFFGLAQMVHHLVYVFDAPCHNTSIYMLTSIMQHLLWLYLSTRANLIKNE
jgi:hypothetical protein